MAAKRKEKQIENANYMQAQPQYLPNQQPDSPRIIRRRTERKVRKRFQTFKIFLIASGLGIFSLMFIQLYIDTQITQVHYEIQQLRFDIGQELSVNEQLAAQISELSQRSRIIEIATERGLTFNENVIINIPR